MNSLIKMVPNVKKFNSYLFDINKGITPIMLSGLTDVGKVHLAYATEYYVEKPICIITYNELQAKKIMKDLEFFNDNIEYFPKREILGFDYVTESKDILYKRIDVLNNVINKKSKVIVTTIEAVMQKMISKESLYKNILKLKVGDSSYSLEQIKEKLVLLGFERYDLIEGKGQFSVRGGIVDIAISDKEGVRIEFWGDEIDSIRHFNIATQRSTEMIDSIEIYPAFEFVLERNIENVCEKIKEKDYSGKLEDKIEEDIEEIKNGEFLNKIDKYFDCFYQNTNTFLDYLENNFIIFLDEIEKIKVRTENILKDNQTLMKSIVEKGRIVPNSIEIMNDYIHVMENLNNKQIVYLEKQDIGFVDKQSMHAKRNGYSFSYREVNFFRSSMDLLFKEVEEARKRAKTTVILGGSPENCKKISNLLLEKEIPNNYLEKIEDEIAPGDVIVTTGALSAGFECYDLELLVISTEEVFNFKTKRRRNPKAFKDAENIVFEDLHEGDFVVHKVHGIGEYIGVNTIKADGITKDYIKVKYKDDDILYIPTNNLDNIRKYIGAGEAKPKVNRLGSKEWANTKNKVKNNLRVVAEELIELYAKRQKMQGFAFSKDSIWQKEFEDAFEYEETDDQLRCIEEMKKDMESIRPMDRLLCGDVGYGKTEVAIRGAFKACLDQKQVAYLVPTTILANQQYESFKERMEKFPIKVELLNRFRTKKEQETIIKKLELGEIDVIIGTHRLLSKDVKFKNLGLLIIDEEHRFGVKDKEKIKELKNNIDVLTMTATPIPRTLHMSIVGMRDMSVIYEPPQNRKPVQTYVLEYDPEVIKEAITKELERGGQVFYLFNKVETIMKKADEISKLVPEAKVEFAHGKMTGTELEDIMQRFINNEINVLVCTTILESGIDIPNANTIIVENADRLGLAQLYQIRGRVRKKR